MVVYAANQEINVHALRVLCNSKEKKEMVCKKDIADRKGPILSLLVEWLKSFSRKMKMKMG